MTGIRSIFGLAVLIAMLGLSFASLPDGVSAQGKSKAPSTLVQEHKDACIDAGGSSFDSVEAGGYTMSRCTFEGGLEEICDHTSGQSECDTWQPHRRATNAVVRYHQVERSR